MEIHVSDGAAISVSAKTTTVGPGYHIHICDLLRRMGRDLGCNWLPGSDEYGDETDYFDTGDRESLNHQMLRWLSALCEYILENPEEMSSSGIAIAMPIDVRYTANAYLITSMGPRSRQWAEQVAKEQANGRDFFAWWNLGQDALYHRNLALCLLWTEVRWREPLLDSESDTLAEVLNHLEEAYRLDPSLPLPVPEWREIAALLERLDSVPEAWRAWDVGSHADRIGYRREDVRVNLAGGWIIAIPGRFATSWDDDGTWCGWDSAMTVWLTMFTSQDKDTDRLAKEIIGDVKLYSDDVVSFEAGAQLGKGSFAWKEEEQVWYFRARVAVDGKYCACTICYDAEELREQALAIWHSLSRG